MQVFRRITLSQAALLASLALFIFVCAPMFANDQPYLDDRYLILMQKQVDFWAPTRAFQYMWGSYRLFYTSLMGPVYGLGDHLWIARTIGLTLHMANAVLLFFILGKLRWSAASRFFAFGLYLFFPFSLEGVAWPSNISQYPFAPFLTLSGAALALSWDERHWRVLAGAVLMGLSVWVHEQVGPLIILLLIVIGAGLPRRPAVVLSAVSLLIVAGNFALIYATRASNMRLTGPEAGSLSNAWKHIDFAPKLIKTTPLGEYFYATGGLGGSAFRWAMAVLVAALVAFASWRGRDAATSSSWSDPVRSWFWPGVFVMAIGAYAVSLIPTMMTPIPWHTGRTIYIPFILFTIAIGVLVDQFLRWTGSALAVVAASALTLATITWSSMSLQAEAKAFDLQTRINVKRADQLNALIGGEIRDGKVVVIVAGYRYGDTERPLFGEHFTGMTPAEIKAALGMPVYDFAGRTYPELFGGAHWPGMCLGSDGRAAVNPSLLKDSRTADMVKGADHIIFAVWREDAGWGIQRPGGAVPAFPEHMPRCPKDGDSGQ